MIKVKVIIEVEIANNQGDDIIPNHLLVDDVRSNVSAIGTIGKKYWLGGDSEGKLTKFDYEIIEEE